MNARRMRRLALVSPLLLALLLTGVVGPSPVRAADSVWLGEYYANPWLMGPPVLVREDGAINFNWGTGSPDPLVPADNFSVRWTRKLTFDAGRYRFSTETDDGVRLFLDGQLIIDQWRDQPATVYTAERDLSAGTHSLRMEYYEASGGAVARLTWTRVDTPPPAGAWRGEYFTNPWLSGSPALVRDDAAVSFDWGTGSPAPGLPSDYFSVRWTRNVAFDAGRYRFTTETDDGVRLYLDGVLIIDKWRDQPATVYTAERDISAGTHALRMEYYEASGGAVARLSWKRTDAPTPAPTGPWRGEYFTNPSLSGSPALVRDDAAINFNWGAGSPDPAIPADGFSVRWTRTVNFSGGRYRFKTTTDDGVRLYVDGRLVINRWYDMPRTSFTVDLTLSKGEHAIRMEYYENLGNASAALSWQKLKDVPTPVGNIITCVRPGYSWVKVYRLDGNTWVDVNPRGYGRVGSSNRLKLDGFIVDTARYGGEGHPYRVELWSNGVRIQSVGDTARGEAPFRVRAWADNYTPWACW